MSYDIDDEEIGCPRCGGTVEEHALRATWQPITLVRTDHEAPAEDAHARFLRTVADRAEAGYVNPPVGPIEARAAADKARMADAKRRAILAPLR